MSCYRMLEEKKAEEGDTTERIEKSDDKKEIEEEEKKKMIDVKEEISRTEVEKKKKVLEQAVEGAARRRAPTGGIRVPGFLRVSRSRDKNKVGTSHRGLPAMMRRGMSSNVQVHKPRRC